MCYARDAMAKFDVKAMSEADKKVAYERFLLAMDAWAKDGAASVTCDSCGAVIAFEQKGTATFHSCECGKFDGVMRGI
jgi:hypothetical protein